jgi:DHA2 family multidrug resistance protein-like MFS transporter
LIAGGLVLAAVGFALLAQIDETTSFALIAAGLAISSFGLAPVFTLATDLVVGSAPPERAGSASSISETTAELGGALGIAILGSIGAALYRTELARTMPAGVPPEAQEAARDTLGGALSAAGQLPTEVGSMLLEAARAAFLQGLQLTVVISVAVSLAAAALVFVGLRNVKRDSEHDEKSVTSDGAS